MGWEREAWSISGLYLRLWAGWAGKRGHTGGRSGNIFCWITPRAPCHSVVCVRVGVHMCDCGLDMPGDPRVGAHWGAWRGSIERCELVESCQAGAEPPGALLFISEPGVRVPCPLGGLGWCYFLREAPGTRSLPHGMGAASTHARTHCQHDLIRGGGYSLVAADGREGL